jgi:hypothetical protein
MEVPEIATDQDFQAHVREGTGFVAAILYFST